MSTGLEPCRATPIWLRQGDERPSARRFSPRWWVSGESRSSPRCFRWTLRKRHRCFAADRRWPAWWWWSAPMTCSALIATTFYEVLTAHARRWRPATAGCRLVRTDCF